MRAMPGSPSQPPSANEPAARIAHVIVALRGGGAEHSLQRLVTADDQFTHTVFCFGEPTPLGAAMADAGVEVHYLPLNPLAVWRLRNTLLRERFRLVHGWMYYGALLAALVRSRGAGQRLIWNLRTSLDGAPLSGRLRLTMGLLRWLRRDMVVFNSHAGLASHTQLGFARPQHCVISNGIDLERFRPDPARRQVWRKNQQLDATTRAVALVGRWHEDKGVGDFLAAGARLLTQADVPPVRLFLIGAGMTTDNPALTQQLQSAGLKPEQLTLLPEQPDIEAAYAGMDLLVLASHREGLPNVMLEAMACGTPVVGTRVGDVPRIQPDELFTAPPKDVDALFAVLCFALAYGADGVAANRQRVQETYGLQQCIEAYAELHKRLLEQP